MRNENLRITNVILLIACTLFTLQGKAQTIIYQQNFDSVNQGMIPTSSSSQDGWLVNGPTTQLNDGIGYLAHRMGIHSGGQAISGRSLGISFYKTYNGTFYSGNFGGQFTNCSYDTSFDLAAFRIVPTTDFETITMQFDWKGAGEQYGGSWVDYGQVGYSTTGGAPFTWLTTGGQTGNGLYHSRGSSNVTTATVSFPAIAANKPNFTIAFRSKADECGGYAPQFIIDNIIVRGTPISTDRTLTVSEAYTGASYGNGPHTFANNTSVTATSGTRAGYNIVGWEGTGSVPASGSEGMVTFNITQNSSIEWLWEAIRPEFHNYGGTEQLTFNNSKINTENPVFRLSHKGGTANGYQIQISNSADFTSGTVSQTFTGTYAAETENNFTFTEGSFISGATYYVRAAVDMGGGYLTDGWTTETYSFTYQTPKEIPDWFQTTQAQFQTGTLSGVNANASHNVVTGAGGNRVVNGDFSNASGTGWTSYKSNSNLTIDLHSDDCSNCPSGTTRNLKFSAWGNASNGNLLVVSQEIDLTNVNQITYNASSYYNSGSNPPSNRISTLRFMIGGGTNDESGTSLHTTQQAFTSSSYQTNILYDPNVVINTSGYTGVHRIKFVVKFTGSSQNSLVSFYVNNVVANASSSGTITSTPIHLASVQEAIGYEAVKWNQTLNSGELTLKIQHSADGETGWADVPGYTAISTTGDGEQSYDLSTMTAYPHIRLVGNLNGENLTLLDWAVEFIKEDEDCPTTTTWDGSNWSHGIPNELTKRIIFDGNFSSADSNTISGNLTGCTLEVVSGNVVINSGHSVTLDNEIIITGGTFTLENDASLVQNNDVVNSGIIKVKRNTTNMVKFDATYWSSPVAGQNLRGFSPETLTNRFYIYNGYNAAPTGISQHFKAVFVNDANYPMPNPIPTEWEVPESELNGNLFKMDAYTFKPGWGYSIRVPNNWPHALGTEGDVLSEEFDGVPHNGEVIVPAYGKYTMVGNPYPSPIQTMGPQGFFEANEDVGTLHFWTHHFDVTELPEYNTNYVTYTSLGSAGNQPGVTGEPIPNGNIAVAQGFVVENSSIAEEQSTQKWDVIFRNEMRTKESGIFFKENHDEGDRHRYWINLTNESDVQIAQILVGYTPEATYEVDHQIDGRRMGTAPLFSWIGENDYTVQGRPMPFEIEDIVPLGYVANRDGKYKMSLHGFDGFFSDEIVRIYIRDNQTQEEHDLMSSDYWFESVEGEYPNRFEIFYKVEEVLDNEELDLNAIQIYHEGANIMVKSSKEKILSVELWDISGRKLHQNQKVNSHLYSISKSNFGTQVLLVTVMTERGEIKRKKIINY